MTTSTLTWTERVLASTTDEIRPVERDRIGIAAGQPMLYPSARLIAQYIHDIPEGESRDIATMRRDLAARSGAIATSLVTTRQRLRLIAEAVFDQLDDGALLSEVTPVWRVLDEYSGRILDELSYEPAFLFDLRACERSSSAGVVKQAA